MFVQSLWELHALFSEGAVDEIHSVVFPRFRVILRTGSVPDRFPSSIKGKGSATRDYLTAPSMPLLHFGMQGMSHSFSHPLSQECVASLVQWFIKALTL